MPRLRQSEIEDAFAELAEAKRAVTGGDVVILDGRKINDAIAEEITTDETLLAGGEGDTGGVRVQIPRSEVAQTPKRGTPISVNGTEWEVVSAVQRKGIVEVNCGQIVTEGS